MQRNKTNEENLQPPLYSWSVHIKIETTRTNRHAYVSRKGKERNDKQNATGAIIKRMSLTKGKMCEYILCAAFGDAGFVRGKNRFVCNVRQTSSAKTHYNLKRSQK